MEHLITPAGYKPVLDLRETQVAIKEIKDFFQRELAKQLNKKKAAKEPAAPKAAAKPAAPVQQAAPAPVVEEGIPGDVVAAIMAAIHAMGNGKYTLKAVRRAANGWSKAGVNDTTAPF